jgi:hypothetical protein
MRLTARQRHDNETRIRAAIERLLQGQIPPGGKCDVKTLAHEAGVDRTAFYGTRPYAHLREEFEARLEAMHKAGDIPDPRDAQISRLKTEAGTLRQRISRQDTTITELTGFRTQALARLAAQHDEITRLRQRSDQTARVRRLPDRASPGTGPCN